MFKNQDDRAAGLQPRGLGNSRFRLLAALVWPVLFGALPIGPAFALIQNVPAAKSTENSLRPAVEPDGPTIRAAVRTQDLTESGVAWTLEQLEAIAFEHHPALAEAQAAIQALEGKRIQVGLKPNTHIGFLGQQLFSGGEAEQFGLFVGQRVIRGGKLEWNRAVVSGEIDMATQRLVARQQRLLTDIRLDYYSVLIAQRRCEVLGELERLASSSVESVNRLIAAQEASRIDLLRAQTDLQRIRAESAAATQDLQSRWRRLASLVGMSDPGSGTVLGSIDLPGEDLQRDELLAFIQQQSPDVQEAVAGIDRAHNNLHRQKVEAVPDLDLQLIVQHDNATGGPNAIIQVTFPVPRRDWNQGGICQAEAELAQAAQTRRRKEMEIARRFAEVWQLYQGNLLRIREYQAPGGMIESARESAELVRRAWQSGEIRFLDLIAAQRALAEAELLLLDALAGHWASRAELEGLLLRDSLAD